MSLKVAPKNVFLNFYAKNWTEHYEQMRKNKPDLIIADMHCYQIFKFAKENNIPSIVHYADSLEIVQ
jgi:nucleoside phosphorylase